MYGDDGSDYRWLMIGNSSATQSAWTRFEDKVFEHALVVFPEEMADRWEKIADRLPGKSAVEVRAHFEALVDDVLEIDSGRVELPSYSDESALGWEAESTQISFSKNRHGEVERKKGTPWTVEEHRLFLIGLKTYGKGDWRSISRNVVVTRTPTQVASHAQKYHLRQDSVKKDRKRSSIHDITTTADTLPIPPPADFPNQGGSMEYQNFNYPHVKTTE
ncbi:Transcription factor DIVARICATA like [Actinidia chinensis var. chinensis]|uniref:Transcription factor DIVARICATA like n=1 Tax=Actinidia chinensis var. chinensis TaxID=1590841 RepID=A0A2R6PKT1_ACTCC|nr:Transcription factor DIVARICATA like [Actinidia chinensis var. chinensis]